MSGNLNLVCAVRKHMYTGDEFAVCSSSCVFAPRNEFWMIVFVCRTSNMLSGPGVCWEMLALFVVCSHLKLRVVNACDVFRLEYP